MFSPVPAHMTEARSTKWRKQILSVVNNLCRYGFLGCLLFTGASYAAPTLDAAFALNYSITGLGGIAGVPTAYGGLTFKDANTVLIGGAANSPIAKIYS